MTQDRITIDEADKHTALWVKLMKYWQAREQRLYVRLAGDLDAHDTAKLRGQLAELRAYMNLGKAPPDNE
jgi:hypothetical protein